MEKTILEIKGLNKSYKNNVVFNDLDFKLYENDILALVGSNGAGKTTLIEIISGIKKYDSGNIKYIVSKTKFLSNLNVCFQEGGYPYGIRAFDIILLFSNVYGVLKDEYLYTKLKIKELENKSMNSLSFGQRKRFELYIALFSGVKYIILDEITSGVDVWMRIVVLDILKKYIKKNKLTLIYITHNFEEIKSICNRVVLLTRSGIVLDKRINNKMNLKNEIESKIKEEQKILNIKN